MRKPRFLMFYMTVLLSIGAAMVFGLLFTRLAKRIHLPNVTAYLVAGLAIGPFGLKLVPAGTILDGMNIITSVALGFIAFSIGGEFKLAHLKMIGKSAVTICMLQACMATLLVDAALLLCGFDAPVAITLGAIAAATAPAATLMVVRQYRAKGPVTSTLLPVVAMDDAVGLMLFSVSIAVATVLAGTGAITVNSVLIQPIVEILVSLAVGGIIGLLLSLGMRIFHSQQNRLCLSIAAVFVGIALAEKLGLSSLLLCMMTGAVYCNIGMDSEKVMDLCDGWTPPLLMMFFVVSGAELDLSVVPSVGLLGVIYLLARSCGKYFGSYIGSVITHSDERIKKYLGLTLLPQAGVAIGMAQLAISALPAYGGTIRAVVLCATLIYELVGPLITKKALSAAGEIAIEKA